MTKNGAQHVCFEWKPGTKYRLCYNCQKALLGVVGEFFGFPQRAKAFSSANASDAAKGARDIIFEQIGCRPLAASEAFAVGGRMPPQIDRQTTMKAAIAQLEISLAVMITNEPINRAEGKTEQADLEAVNASEIRQALAVLKAADAGPIWPEPKA
jgi:hypothetical protein